MFLPVVTLYIFIARNGTFSQICSNVSQFTVSLLAVYLYVCNADTSHAQHVQSHSRVGTVHYANTHTTFLCHMYI